MEMSTPQVPLPESTHAQPVSASNDSMKPLKKSRTHKKHRSARRPHKKRPPRVATASSAPSARDSKRIARDYEKSADQPKRPRNQYSQEDLSKAIRACTSKKRMSIRKAAKKYSIPSTTLADKISGKHLGPKGRPYKLPEVVEEDLAALIRNYCGKGNVLDPSLFVTIAKKYVESHPLCHGITFSASGGWLGKFLERNELKKFEYGTSRTLGVHRTIVTTPALVDSFFGAYQTAYANYLKYLSVALNIPVIDLPESEVSKGIFAIDETSFSNGAPLEYELKKLNDAQIYSLNPLGPGRSKVNASLLEVYSADGAMPFHVLTTTRMLTPTEKDQLSSIDARSQLLFCELESGHFDAIRHANVLERIGLLRPNLPSLVIQDSRNTTTSPGSTIEPQQSRIHLVCLPHSSSWYLQVPDDLAFASINSRHYSEIDSVWLVKHQVPNLMQTLDIFLRARRDVLTPTLILSSFERCGQYPLSARAIRTKAEQVRQRCRSAKQWQDTQKLSLR